MTLSETVFTVALYLGPGLAGLSLVDLGKLSLGRRLFGGLCLSLVMVPYLYLASSLVGRVNPRPAIVVALAVVLALVGLASRRLGRRPRLILAPLVGRPTRREALVVWGCLMAFATLANLPRLDMFLAGGAVQRIPLWDETWHLAQLVSVARTGIPPDHYLFPGVRLAYYYGAWVHPAVVGNIPSGVSLARAMAIHSWMVSFTFSGLAYLLLQRFVRTTWPRIVGLAFFTVLGGLDIFPSMPSISQVDWWQERVGWLVSHQQISQWITLYEWVPQHLFAGGLFLMGLWLWRSMPDRSILRNASLAALLGLTFSTSPFIFAADVLAIAIVLVHERRRVGASLRADPWRALGVALLLLLCVILPAWPVAGIYLEHESRIELNDWRVPLVQSLRGGAPGYEQFDRALTLFGLPVVGTLVGFIEMGAPFLLYLGWWFTRATRRERYGDAGWGALLGFQPLIFFTATVLLRDSAGGGLSMRGLIPSQVLVCFGAALFLDQRLPSLRSQSAKPWAAIYLLAALAIAQGASAAAEWRDNSADLLKWMWSGGKWERAFPYIEWLNTETPADSIVVEQGCPDSDGQEYRWLERRRVVLPGCAATMALFERDRDFMIPADYRRYRAAASAAKGEVRQLIGLLDLPGKNDAPLFEVVWPGGTMPSSGRLVYEDSQVLIFDIR